jgi:hypothetical protein
LRDRFKPRDAAICPGAAFNDQAAAEGQLGEERGGATAGA